MICYVGPNWYSHLGLINPCYWVFYTITLNYKLASLAYGNKKHFWNCVNARDYFLILFKIFPLYLPWVGLKTSLVAQTVKRLPTMRETQVQSLGWEDFLEKEMATHSSILAWKIPWMVEPGRLQSMGSQRVGHDWATSQLHFCYWTHRNLSCSWVLL